MDAFEIGFGSRCFLSAVRFIVYLAEFAHIYQLPTQPATDFPTKCIPFADRHNSNCAKCQLII